MTGSKATRSGSSVLLLPKKAVTDGVRRQWPLSDNENRVVRESPVLQTAAPTGLCTDRSDVSLPSGRTPGDPVASDVAAADVGAYGASAPNVIVPVRRVV